MSEAKFTKGPWVYESRSSLIIGDDEVAIVPEDDDGYLIACAPEMYKNIEEDIEILKRHAEKHVIGTCELQAVQLRIKRKRYLLAKARGEHDTNS